MFIAAIFAPDFYHIHVHCAFTYLLFFVLLLLLLNTVIEGVCRQQVGLPARFETVDFVRALSRC